MDILFIGMHTCVEGSKRQLPPWMMQKVGATATHVSDSNNAVETNCYIKKGDIIKTNATKKDHKSESSKRNSNLRAKCEVMGRKKLDQQDGSSDKVTQKKRKGDRSKDRDQRSSIKKRKKLEDPSHGCYDVSPVSDDAMDLTLEDLMAIAEQVIF